MKCNYIKKTPFNRGMYAIECEAVAGDNVVGSNLRFSLFSQILVSSLFPLKFNSPNSTLIPSSKILSLSKAKVLKYL